MNVKKFRYALETVAVYAVYGFFRLLPLDLASGAGGAFGRVVGPYLPSSRTARANLAATFLHRSEAEREEVVRGMWENLGRVVAEYSHLKDVVRTRIEIVGQEHLDAVRKSGKPAILFSGHIANWEACGVTGLRGGFDLHVVYRRPNNRGVDGLLGRARQSAGAKGSIAKGASGAKEIFGVLRKNGVVGMLVDQKQSDGIPVPFFGRDAMTSPAIAVFARRFDCPLLPIQIERLEGANFRLTVHPPLHAEGDDQAVMRTINGYLERWIALHPEQWLWMHRRWG